MRATGAMTVLALCLLAVSGTATQASRRTRTWQKEDKKSTFARPKAPGSPQRTAALSQGLQRATDRARLKLEVGGLDPEALCLKQSVLSIEDSVASKYGTMKGWMTQNEWGSEIRKINATEHPVVTIGIDGFPCAKYGCCQHNMRIRLGGSDWFVVQHVINEYVVSLAALLPWQPTTILEGGANIGVATSLFAFMYPDAKIIALEPEPDNCALLKENTQIFQNVKVLCVGLWDKADASVRLIQGGDGAAWAWRLQEVPAGTAGAPKTTSVAALLEQSDFESFDMAKIDVEGAEFNVFEPDADTNWVDRTEVMMLELHWQYGDIDRLRRGFTGRGFFQAKSGEYDIFTRKQLDVAASRKSS